MLEISSIMMAAPVVTSSAVGVAVTFFRMVPSAEVIYMNNTFILIGFLGIAGAIIGVGV